MAAIDRTDALPFWAQLAELLAAAIADGTWEPGQLLPSEADLGDFYGVSRPVVRQALGHLAGQGLVHKEKGRGTFVTRPRRAQFVVQEVRGFADEMAEQGLRVDTDVLDLRRATVPPEEAAALSVPIGSEVLRVERLRRVEGEPLCLVTTWLPLPRFDGLDAADLATASLYDVLRDFYAVVPRSGTRRVEAAAADDRTASLLGVKRGTPVLRLSSVSVDQDGTPFESFRAVYRADRTSFDIRVAAAKGST
jgi:GntR family transcriptional regulator